MIIGLDVGGTNTDVVLLGQEGILRQTKVPTDHSNLFESVTAGLEVITRDIPAGDIRRVVLSTTLTTNAIVEKKLAATGMIVCGGPGIDPELFRTNDQYFSVAGSIDHRGREIQPIDHKEIRTIASRWRTEGLRQVGVVGKFSVRNPKHELEIQELLRGALTISLSAIGSRATSVSRDESLRPISMLPYTPFIRNSSKQCVTLCAGRAWTFPSISSKPMGER